ncbi:DUF2179 domain-containing protein [bacterium]|nr:DUF2179 domain-containing protein [bacterium]MBU1636860.1 DUF2179 domain-containing protein [bacterium]MBU1919877.1 DUF2179 domain-containing protein [bacterium]
MANLETIFGHELMGWLIIPILIFLARVIDVSLGTIRVIFIARGMRFLAPFFGFFEVLIWLVVISQVFSNLTHWIYYISYATGFAAGNYVGMVLENRLAIGKAILRVITRVDAEQLANVLREKRYVLTTIDGEGREGPVKILFMVVSRAQLPGLIDLVKQYNPRAVYTIEDVRFVGEGLPASAGIPRKRINNLHRWVNRIFK